MRLAKWILGLILVGAGGLFLMIIIGLGPANFGRMVLGIGRGYDSKPPTLPASLSNPTVLIFSKTNGYRDDEQIAAANQALEEIALQKGWSSFTTENAAVFNVKQLAGFKVVVWNSVSGDVLTPQQRVVFRNWIEQGGGFVGLHGSGGDPSYDWRWYVNDLIGAQFIGHTVGPQFQRAKLTIEDPTHPATRHLPRSWTRTDEWYSFASSPRRKRYHVLVSIDENSYRPEMKLPLSSAKDLRMGRDHPMVWAHCVHKGRAFYSALGHTASSYSEPLHRQMLGGAIAWAAGLDGSGCGDRKPVAG